LIECSLGDLRPSVIVKGFEAFLVQQSGGHDELSEKGDFMAASGAMEACLSEYPADKICLAPPSLRKAIQGRSTGKLGGRIRFTEK
jgi:hypothetical protein